MGLSTFEENLQKELTRLESENERLKEEINVLIKNTWSEHNKLQADKVELLEALKDAKSYLHGIRPIEQELESLLSKHEAK